MAKALEERDVAHVGEQTCSFRADDVAASQAFRRSFHALPASMPITHLPSSDCSVQMAPWSLKASATQIRRKAAADF